MASTWCYSSPQWSWSTVALVSLLSQRQRQHGSYQECHHFEISSDVQARLFIHQGIKQCHDAIVILFEVNQMSQWKRQVLVPVMEQHGSEAPGEPISEEAPFIWASADSNCIKETGHIVEEAEPVLTGGEDGKSLMMLPVTCDLPAFTQQAPLLGSRHEKFSIRLGDTKISDETFEAFLVGMGWVPLLSYTFWNRNLALHHLLAYFLLLKTAASCHGFHGSIFPSVPSCKRIR